MDSVAEAYLALLAKRGIEYLFANAGNDFAPLGEAFANTAREFVPILFTARRSPLTEAGMPGARDVYIHWTQEMFDQAGMLREIVKWDYELRSGQ